MSELKNGVRCYVSDISSEAALEAENEKVFVGVGVDGRLVCQDANNKISALWEYVTNIPEKDTLEYSFDTWPRGVVYLRFTEKDSKAKSHYLVVSVNEDGVTINTEMYYFSSLKTNFEMSTDLCESWKPCSLEVE